MVAAFQFAIRSTALLLTLSGLLPPLLAQNLKTPEFLEGVDKGFDHVYNLDYDSARTAFQNLQQRYPQHPGPPLYLALTLWQQELFRRQDLRLDRFVSPESFMQATARQMPTEERNAFFRYIEESQAACQAILKQQPRNRDARYFLGSAYGALAAFAMTIDHDKREAFRQGKQAYQYHQQNDYHKNDRHAIEKRIIRKSSVCPRWQKFQHSRKRYGE